MCLLDLVGFFDDCLRTGLGNIRCNVRAAEDMRLLVDVRDAWLCIWGLEESTDKVGELDDIPEDCMVVDGIGENQFRRSLFAVLQFCFASEMPRLNHK